MLSLTFNNGLREMVDGYQYGDLVKRRANLDAWPLMNLDMRAANVSITLDLCQRLGW